MYILLEKTLKMIQSNLQHIYPRRSTCLRLLPSQELLPILGQLSPDFRALSVPVVQILSSHRP